MFSALSDIHVAWSRTDKKLLEKKIRLQEASHGEGVSKKSGYDFIRALRLFVVIQSISLFGWATWSGQPIFATE